MLIYCEHGSQVNYKFRELNSCQGESANIIFIQIHSRKFNLEDRWILTHWGLRKVSVLHKEKLWNCMHILLFRSHFDWPSGAICRNGAAGYYQYGLIISQNVDTGRERVNEASPVVSHVQNPITMTVFGCDAPFDFFFHLIKCVLDDLKQFTVWFLC